jgi:hypothetical protein
VVVAQTVAVAVKVGHDGRCPGCGDLAPRYVGTFCPTCVRLAHCPHGRPVGLANASVSGGLLALHRHDESACCLATDGPLTIEGAPGRAAEEVRRRDRLARPPLDPAAV